MTSEIASARHGPQVRSAARSAMSSAASRPKPKKRMLNLLRSPSPPMMPIAVHHFASRVRSNRASAKSAAVHQSWSNTTGWKRLPGRRKSGCIAHARAVNSCAKRPPPSSRAIPTASSVIAAPAIAGSMRSDTSESPPIARSTIAMIAIAGGKSMRKSRKWLPIAA